MQWLSLLLWGALAVYGARSPRRAAAARLMLSVGLAASMACQLRLLWLDGLLTPATALPLHLCGLMGVMSIPMLWFGWKRVYHFSLLLGAPCALLTLCFPAVIASSRPVLMALAFNRLHVLIICASLFLYAQKEPPPSSAGNSLLLGSGYLLFIAAFNRVFHTNYLFLTVPPADTPLATLFSRGGAYYLSALVLLAMLCMTFMIRFWHSRALAYLLIGENRSAYSRCSRYTSPCTTPRRGLKSSRSAR